MTPLPYRSRSLLADGREVVWFDETDPAGRDRVDLRDLPPRALGDPLARPGEVRRDPLTGDHVVIASHRMDRTFLPPADRCPLCPTTPGRAPSEVPGPYDVVVFENRFPSLSGPTVLPTGPTTGPTTSPDLLDGEALFPARPATGRCEVVCFTADHDADVASLPLRRIRTVIEAWADRTARLSALPGVRQVFCFENRGEEVGVTLHHPHGQIYAYPFLPPYTARMVEQARDHRRRSGSSLLADVLSAERRAGTRVVLAGTRWTAYVPAAARWPVEVHLAPHRDVADLAGLDEPEREELATIYRELLRRVDRFFDRPLPYISAWHQAPVGADRDLGRLHLQLFSLMRSPGRMKYLAGSESGVGAWINDTTPERIADRLREVAS